jgi:hypothetical protein
MNKAKPEDVNMQPVEFGITRILTDYAHKLPGHCTTPKQPPYRAPQQNLDICLHN